MQQYIAPEMSLFGPINIPMNAYNNYRVYGSILCFLMFVCVFIGVKFVSKFSPIALFCVIFSIACVYIGVFVANPGRGPRLGFFTVAFTSYCGTVLMHFLYLMVPKRCKF